ncbi:Signal recognition particle receptor FtsY [Rhizobium rhizogenes]|uniref:Signal recognition particle receptor FtsY n=1 Tax=Rhizobium rhizogenes TaxID=359 RepID=A0AAN2DDM0_RHIRH|nr:MULTISPECIES: signal recognition particle-docking protein FtsY [Rhizobium/Agrobacterium group]AXO68327.1 signal recognition particle-docking protein FtsY [Rhizobium rhizogenes]MCZ7443630.1 signal recognition particle-docking protein FtsY [Rhizobium rhizogenes]NSZ80196.1 signal recognition particle-docking protein FtsY [Agrobacterium tumefaciens]NTE57699.1 signal recognition particle-docking protein FtsY [Agrobacterium tumefaciens]NTE72203.1 signal recognition particle-docking protein FtsY [
MALGFIKKVFSFGKDKAETDERPQEDAAPERGNENASFEAALSEAEAHNPVDEDPVSELEMETAGGPAPDETLDAVLSEEEDEEDAPLLPGAELSGDMGVVPLSLLQAEAAAEEQAEPLPEAVLDADAMDALLDEAESADAAELPVVPQALPKGFSSASEREEPVAEAPQPKLSWFQRLRAGLARTSSQLTTQISALFTKRKLDEDTLDELEDLLIQSDLGVETAMRITGALSSERYGKDVSGEDVARIMAGEITKVLKPVAKPLELDLSHKPHVILVVGVNGTGKTTTIGKLAAKLSGSGLKVMLAAGDTFRAAAIEQLKIWADRTGSQFIGTKLGADASGLAYDAYEQARAQKSDVLIIDTAGRLQNKTELMAELEKIVRVLGKLDPDAPHTVLQTLDATTGQNAMNQVEIFRNVAGVSGLIMTKLDGTARGGILVAIAAKHKLPVYFIGVGEGVDDLEPFEAEDFAKAIAGV